MSRVRDDIQVTFRVLKRVSTPGHPCYSKAMIAKREGLSDDKVGRALGRTAELVGGELVETRNNRIVPTALGRAFRDLAEQLLALGQSQAEAAEVLRVGIGPGVDGPVLAAAVERFAAEWAGIVGLDLSAVQDGFRGAVRDGRMALVVAAIRENEDPDDEAIEPATPLSVLIPGGGHRFAGSADPIDPDHFSPADRVFLSPLAVSSATALLGRVPAANRIVVGRPDLLHHLVSRGAGLGIDYAHPSSRYGASFGCRPVTGAEPLSLGLWCSPRMGDPARAFGAAVRSAVRDAALPTLPPVEVPEGGPMSELDPLPSPPLPV